MSHSGLCHSRLCRSGLYRIPTYSMSFEIMLFGILSVYRLIYIFFLSGTHFRNCSRIEIFVQFFDVTELNLTQPKKFVKISHLFLKAWEFCCTEYMDVQNLHGIFDYLSHSTVVIIIIFIIIIIINNFMHCNIYFMYCIIFSIIPQDGVCCCRSHQV